jgi:hypothetical protein
LSTSKERRGPVKETPGQGNKKRRLREKYYRKRTIIKNEMRKLEKKALNC